MELNREDIELVSLDNLLLDPRNPRLPPQREPYTQEQIIKYMLTDASIIELMASIGESGFFRAEPVLGIPVPEGDPDYRDDTTLLYVVEGNRRLTASKLLRNPDLATVRKNSVRSACEEAKEHPESIPALTYTGREKLLNFLGFKHITGTKAWGALEKALYLKQLRQSQPALTFKELAKIIGSRSDYVAKILTALAIYEVIEAEDFFDLEGVDAESIKFSFITTAISFTGILEFLGMEDGVDPDLQDLDKDRLHDLTKWMFKPVSEGRSRLGESRNIKLLNRVVDAPEALEAFRGGRSLDDAYLLTGAPTEIFRESVNESMTRLQYAQDYAHLARDIARSDVDTLYELRLLAKAVHDMIEAKVKSQETDLL